MDTLHRFWRCDAMQWRWRWRWRWDEIESHVSNPSMDTDPSTEERLRLSAAATTKTKRMRYLVYRLQYYMTSRPDKERRQHRNPIQIPMSPSIYCLGVGASAPPDSAFAEAVYCLYHSAALISMLDLLAQTPSYSNSPVSGRAVAALNDKRAGRSCT